MVFKRRDRRPIYQIVFDFFWPKGGWTRAFHYVRHRLRRLPGTPEFIARGIWAGVFTTFTPFYGLHFVVAAVIARLLNGNLLAALLATFFGNPLTYLPIGVLSLKTGHFILGTQFDEGSHRSLLGKFAHAGFDLWRNVGALFTERDADWAALRLFWNEVFFPYLVGGILPGLIAATAAYYLSVPVLRAYQKRRMAKIAKKMTALRERAREQAARRAEEENHSG
ncbi:MAG: DUF2062 domain-containing protein [Pseudopelagicola sp.]|nr:DUF2062 domain-containing protein [Pseudopelagicola sp.]